MRKTARGLLAWRGIRRRNDRYPGWKVAAPTAPRGGQVFSPGIQKPFKTKSDTSNVACAFFLDDGAPS